MPPFEDFVALNSVDLYREHMSHDFCLLVKIARYQRRLPRVIWQEVVCFLADLVGTIICLSCIELFTLKVVKSKTHEGRVVGLE